jgi:hypothetical protein
LSVEEEKIIRVVPIVGTTGASKVVSPYPSAVVSPSPQKAYSPPILNLNRIKQRLFDVAREQLIRDYGLSSRLRSADDLGDELIAKFGQAWTATETITNRTVYRAAVLALGSNMRAWRTFVPNIEKLQNVLSDYDPNATTRAVTAGTLTKDHLKVLLPGQSSSADADAILRWAALLASAPNYGRVLNDLRSALLATGILEEEILPAVAVVLGTGQWPQCIERMPDETIPDCKAPGMGPTLASEFLRNLHWNGFKPDRHVRRLLKRWFPDVLDQERNRALELADRLGCRQPEALEFLAYSRVGIVVTPSGTPFTVADNLVWALGAYVEKSGRETDTLYRCD